jgi:hypothetical protein
MVSQSIDQREKNLKIREAELKDVEPLIPNLKQLQVMGVDFQLLMRYVMSINEWSVMLSINLAASQIAQITLERVTQITLHPLIEKINQRE